jgi:hypothetical protein
VPCGFTLLSLFLAILRDDAIKTWLLDVFLSWFTTFSTAMPLHTWIRLHLIGSGVKFLRVFCTVLIHVHTPRLLVYLYVYTKLCIVFALHPVLYIHPFGLFKIQLNPHMCPPQSFRCFSYATTTLWLISSKFIIVIFMSYAGLKPVALSMPQGEDALSKCIYIGLFVNALMGFS